ncbi:DUF3578 domain-containing protein [Mesorhizobium sp.]|uniref:MrcB family domain-containing protein n=1 Tax=Mesorhizobium sp. TaxID=1871066 RepID=UPI000FE8BA5F|nr:DUF3578 domain-containing protein [Mesorhizobium sp.]RWQ57821.1 MAG: DUF3578 domain-containing protein [Mesorhizobium sp.]
MRETLQEIVGLQAKYSANQTPEMKQRGILIRRQLPAEMEARRTALQAALGKFGLDAKAEGKDNQGQMSRIPWVRWFSTSRSPSATSGWYVVYLFHPDGSGVSLCLSHGSTQIVGTGFVNRSDAEVAELMRWAASVLGSEFGADPGVRLGVELGTFDLARGYERTTVASKFYPRGRIPPDDVLFADLVRFMGPLAKLYAAQEAGIAPGSISAEMQGLYDDLEKLASPIKDRPKGQGRLSAPMRKLVELHAMAIAERWLRDEGFEYKNVSTTDSCDFRARRGGEDWVIEVKGTTGGLTSVLLTRNEVALHRASHPRNALLVVHGIRLLEGETSPKGGDLAVFSPWRLEDDRLSALAFEYRLPT